ncbi:MAG: serpin family protein [Bacteroidota bacterium]
MMRILLYTSVLSMMVFTGCSDSVSNDTSFPEELGEAEKRILEADQTFGVNIFKDVVEMEADQENVFVSPLSLSMALGMTMNGARGQTFSEMQQTLGFGELTQSEINEGYQGLDDFLTSVDEQVQLGIANSVWSKQGFPIEEPFINDLNTFFGAEAHEMDFNDPQTVEAINQWAADKTNDRILRVLERIPPEMRLYLINAVFFKADWDTQFDPDFTTEVTFYTDDGGEPQIDMMNTSNTFNYLEQDRFQMVDLPYGNGSFSMSLILPKKEEESLDAFIAEEVTAGSVQDWISQMDTTMVLVGLPKFELSYKTKGSTLPTSLSEMGMPTAFTPRADFTGINPQGELLISSVDQHTFLKVDEEGSEAAAVTVIGVGVTSIGPSYPSVYLNRPFLLLIREQQTGTILFMGKIGNPAAE